MYFLFFFIFFQFGPRFSQNIMESGNCFCQSLFVWCVNHLLKKNKQRVISNTKINIGALAGLQINHQKNTFCLKNESIHLLLLDRSKMFDSIISKRLIKDLHFMFFINSYFMLHYQWNVEKTQVTPTKPTLLQNKGIALNANRCTYFVEKVHPSFTQNYYTTHTCNQQ